MTATPGPHLSLSSVPQNAVPWTQDREARLAAGGSVWYIFQAGEAWRCPVCGHCRGETGSGRGVAVRIHPDQSHEEDRRRIPRETPDRRRAGPTSVHGESFTCKCGTHLDKRDLPVTRKP